MYAKLLRYIAILQVPQAFCGEVSVKDIHHAQVNVHLLLPSLFSVTYDVRDSRRESNPQPTYKHWGSHVPGKKPEIFCFLSAQYLTI